MGSNFSATNKYTWLCLKVLSLLQLKIIICLPKRIRATPYNLFFLISKIQDKRVMICFNLFLKFSDW